MFFILLALIAYTAVIVLSAAASRAIDSNIVTAIVNTVSVFLPVMVAFSQFNKKLVEQGKFGLIIALLSGIALAIFSMSINKSFQTNKVGIVSPLVFGGAIFLSTILSAIFFKEKVSPVQLGGLVFLGLGFILISYAAATGK